MASPASATRSASSGRRETVKYTLFARKAYMLS